MHYRLILYELITQCIITKHFTLSLFLKNMWEDLQKQWGWSLMSNNDNNDERTSTVSIQPWSQATISTLTTMAAQAVHNHTYRNKNDLLIKNLNQETVCWLNNCLKDLLTLYSLFSKCCLPANPARSLISNKNTTKMQ